jgi:hypothetical protein
LRASGLRVSQPDGLARRGGSEQFLEHSSCRLAGATVPGRSLATYKCGLNHGSCHDHNQVQSTSDMPPLRRAFKFSAITRTIAKSCCSRKCWLLCTLRVRRSPTAYHDSLPVTVTQARRPALEARRLAAAGVRRDSRDIS